MNILFAADRRSEVQVLGGVLHELETRGHALIGMRGWMEPKAIDDGVTPDQLLREWPTLTFAREQMPTDALFLASAGTRIPSMIPVVMVDYCWDLLFQPRQAHVTFAYATEMQRDMAGTDGPVVGSPALALLPPQFPETLLFFVPKLRRRGSRIVVWLVAWAARRAANRRGLRLVGMTRQKHGSVAFLRPLMDAWVALNGPIWPPPVQRALQTASIAIHFQSGVHFECFAASVPAYNVAWPMTRGLAPHVASVMAWKRRAIFPGQPSRTVIRSLLQIRAHHELLAGWGGAARFQEQYIGPHDAHSRVADLCEASS